MRVRSMQLEDAAQVASLSEHLGYPATAATIERRLLALKSLPGHACYIAAHQDRSEVIGWVHVYGVHLLESDGYAEIGGLVVQPGSRRQGVGRALLAAAEDWAQEHGYVEVRLRAGLHRTEAHAFYAQVGYTLTKTSHMFRKVLTSGDGSAAPTTRSQC